MEIPDSFKELFPRIFCGTNPGGIGHQWVKTSWIDYAPAMEIWQTPDDEGGFKRQYIQQSLLTILALTKRPMQLTCQDLAMKRL